MRVKRGIQKNKRRKSILKATKGYRFGRSTKKRQAKEAIMHAGTHAFSHRRDKKGDFRALWHIKISAASTQLGVSYSTFMDKLKKNEIELNRKMLADLSENNPETFERIYQKLS